MGRLVPPGKALDVSDDDRARASGWMSRGGVGPSLARNDWSVAAKPPARWRVSVSQRFPMRHLLIPLFFIAVCAAVLAEDSPAPASVAAPPGRLRFESIWLGPRDGSAPVAVELGHLTVLENRARPAGAVGG